MAMRHETMKTTRVSAADEQTAMTMTKMTSKAAANETRTTNVTAKEQYEETTTSAAAEKQDDKTSAATVKKRDEKTTMNEETNMNATGTMEMQGAINLLSFRLGDASTAQRRRVVETRSVQEINREWEERTKCGFGERGVSRFRATLLRGHDMTKELNTLKEEMCETTGVWAKSFRVRMFECEL